jgi:hypothetical protein
MFERKITYLLKVLRQKIVSNQNAVEASYLQLSTLFALGNKRSKLSVFTAKQVSPYI